MRYLLVVQFRLTQQYAKNCRINVLFEPKTALHPLDDWFIDVVCVHRKKIAMATHAPSLLTFFIPYDEAGGAKAIPECIGVLLKNFLCNNNLQKWAEETDELFYAEKNFCKTMDRKILGYMNNFKQYVKNFIDYSSEAKKYICWDKVSQMINNMPVNFDTVSKYIYPKEILMESINN